MNGYTFSTIFWIIICLACAAMEWYNWVHVLTWFSIVALVVFRWFWFKKMYGDDE